MTSRTSKIHLPTMRNLAGLETELAASLARKWIRDHRVLIENLAMDPLFKGKADGMNANWGFKDDHIYIHFYLRELYEGDMEHYVGELVKKRMEELTVRITTTVTDRLEAIAEEMVKGEAAAGQAAAAATAPAEPDRSQKPLTSEDDDSSSDDSCHCYTGTDKDPYNCLIQYS